MAKDTKNVDDFLNFIHVPATQQTANDTLTTLEVVLPTNARERYAIAVHQIDWGMFSMSPNTGAWVQVTLATRDDIAAGDLHPGNPDVLALKELEVISAGAAYAFVWEVQPQTSYFHVPMLLGMRRIFMYITSAATAAQNTGACRIGFTFVKVSLEEFWESTLDYRMDDD